MDTDIELLKDKFISILKGGKSYPLRDCSMCAYTLCYFSDGNDLYYDSGCDCTRYRNTQKRDWSNLDFYFQAANGHLDVIKKFVEDNSPCKET